MQPIKLIIVKKGSRLLRPELDPWETSVPVLIPSAGRNIAVALFSRLLDKITTFILYAKVRKFCQFAKSFNQNYEFNLLEIRELDLR